MNIDQVSQNSNNSESCISPRSKSISLSSKGFSRISCLSCSGAIHFWPIAHLESCFGSNCIILSRILLQIFLNCVCRIFLQYPLKFDQNPYWITQSVFIKWKLQHCRKQAVTLLRDKCELRKSREENGFSSSITSIYELDTGLNPKWPSLRVTFRKMPSLRLLSEKNEGDQLLSLPLKKDRDLNPSAKISFRQEVSKEKSGLPCYFYSWLLSYTSSFCDTRSVGDTWYWHRRGESNLSDRSALMNS